MWAKLFDPKGYTWLGMRENVYLITAFMLLGILLVHSLRQKILPRLQLISFYGAAMVAIADILVVAVMTSLVIIFLRPITQFIYFQF